MYTFCNVAGNRYVLCHSRALFKDYSKLVFIS